MLILTPVYLDTCGDRYIESWVFSRLGAPVNSLMDMPHVNLKKNYSQFLFFWTQRGLKRLENMS
jgi:hypothetical protein